MTRMIWFLHITESNMMIFRWNILNSFWIKSDSSIVTLQLNEKCGYILWLKYSNQERCKIFAPIWFWFDHLIERQWLLKLYQGSDSVNVLMCIWYSGWCIWSSEFWIWYFWCCIWYLGRCIWYYLAMGKLWSSNREAVAGEIIARLGSRKCEHRTQFKTKYDPFLNLIYTTTTTWFKQILFTLYNIMHS